MIPSTLACLKWFVSFICNDGIAFYNDISPKSIVVEPLKDSPTLRHDLYLIKSKASVYIEVVRYIQGLDSYRTSRGSS